MAFDYKDLFARNDRRTASVPALALAAVALVGTNPAVAATIPEVYLISEHTAPTQGSAELSFTTQTAYRVNLNGRLVGTSAQLVNNFDVNVQTSLSFDNDDYNNGVNFDPGDFTDMGETGQGTAALVDAEIGTWDNVNIRDASYTYDTSEQIDFGRNAPMIFKPVEGGFTELVIAELGGLNPFDLWHCEDAACTVAQKLFGGLNDTLSQALFAMQDFAMPDDSPLSQLDQTWLFRFSTPFTGYLRLLENDRRGLYTNARVQMDFIGAGGIPDTDPDSDPSAVPLPTSLPLLAGGLGLMGFVMRRRRKA